MANYRQYQKYRSAPERHGFRTGRVLLIIGIVVVVYLIGKSVFGTHEVALTNGNENAATPTTTNTDAADAVNGNANGNLNVNANANGNLNANTNSNANGNTNTNSNVNAAAGSFSVSKCTTVQSRGTATAKRVALTFNVGTAKEGDLPKVLTALAAGQVPADFFVRGDVATSTPALIKKISDAGFSVYNASYSNPHFNELPESGVAEQLQKADQAISAQTGVTTKPFFRPPYGEADADVVTAVTAAGYCPVTWTVDAMDWSTEYTAAMSQERV
ncbi:MAG: polysaccharide deacetylase family protein, partial [Patescibacteria group bacterium]